MTRLTLLRPGPFSLLVGPARHGRRHQGVPGGGPADRASARLANCLLGNDPDAVTLELTLAGPELVADSDVSLALAGAPFEARVGGEVVPPDACFRLRAGETLRVGGTPAGARAYLAVAGGVLTPAPTLATPLVAGAVLLARGGLRPSRHVMRDWPSPCAAFGVLPGAQCAWFDPAEFAARTWTVGGASNRMGVRLIGEPLSKRLGELESEPAAPGAVQVAHDGRPIVLGVDGQTIGGYPKVAHVIRADLDRLGQLRPGDAARFEWVTPEQASRRWGQCVARRAALERRLGAWA